MNFKWVQWLNFHSRDLKFSDNVPNIITIINKNENKYAKNLQMKWYCPLKTKDVSLKQPSNPLISSGLMKFIKNA